MPDASDAGSGNGKTLVIVESGAKADTISRFLDDDYVVSACFGHVRDLPRRAAERPRSRASPGPTSPSMSITASSPTT